MRQRPPAVMLWPLALHSAHARPSRCHAKPSALAPGIPVPELRPVLNDASPNPLSGQSDSGKSTPTPSVIVPLLPLGPPAHMPHQASPFPCAAILATMALAFTSLAFGFAAFSFGSLDIPWWLEDALLFWLAWIPLMLFEMALDKRFARRKGQGEHADDAAEEGDKQEAEDNADGLSVVERALRHMDGSRCVQSVRDELDAFDAELQASIAKAQPPKASGSQKGRK